MCLARQEAWAACKERGDPSWTLPVLYSATSQSLIFDPDPQRPLELPSPPGNGPGGSAGDEGGLCRALRGQAARAAAAPSGSEERRSAALAHHRPRGQRQEHACYQAGQEAGDLRLPAHSPLQLQGESFELGPLAAGFWRCLPEGCQEAESQGKCPEGRGACHPG